VSRARVEQVVLVLARREVLAPHPNLVFGLADRRLGSREWAVGGYSIADIHLFRLYWRFRNAFNPALDEHPHLSAHYNRMMARPAVKRTCELEAALGYELPP
jgi:glutathione S-transferase